MATLSLLAFFLPLAASVPVDFFKPCDSVGKINSLDVTPCVGSGLCQFPRGQDITINVNFTMGSEITAAKPAVFAYLGFLKVPEPFPMEQDSCGHFSRNCPLAANIEQTYTTHVLIKDAYPKIRVVAEWQIRDQNDQIVICFAVPVQVV
ncbi:NPC intracellular cholesterol transporter 2-like [Littorina saxatilis]|uniref:MD-2-related lipid-recognition domain-containing protein n=1 Tax=Littorina saxatilis TaxID=31220 RepID=A0AAN9BH10_9CAEN